MADNPEARLLRRVMDAGLPPEDRSAAESLSRTTTRSRSGSRTTPCSWTMVEYHCLPGGLVEVKDFRDPRSMRFQRYDPKRPGQPMLVPWVEDDVLPRG